MNTLDRAEIRTLFEDQREPLYRFLYRLTRNASDAEDLLQETFLQIHRSRAGWQRGRPVRPWAFGVAKNVWLMDCL